MRRRIRWAIVATVGVALVAFGIPLAIVLAQELHDDAVLELEREATQAAERVPASFLRTDDPVELPTGSIGAVYGIYGTNGRRLAGKGPDVGGSSVRAAIGGRVTDATVDGQIVVAIPVTSEERVFAVIRAERHTADITGRIRRAWALMVALGVGILAAAVAAAHAVTRRLTRPVDRLIVDVERLGAGDHVIEDHRTGISEIDAAHRSLVAAAGNVGELLARERSFSSDVSHQLRTPLTGLRLDLDALSSSPSAAQRGDLNDAHLQLDRLEATIDQLLALARETTIGAEPIDVEPVVRDSQSLWHGVLAAEGRPLRLVIDNPVPRAVINPAALRQILDVLLSNAQRHGQGRVRLHVHATESSVAIDVEDEGPGFDPDRSDPFQRRTGSAGHGIGLALARTLAGAEGADLRFVDTGPSPTIRLLIRS